MIEKINIDKFEYLIGNSYDKNKETILFIHGASINAFFWRHQIESLSKNFNTIAINLPGRYENSPVFEKDSIDSYSSHIFEFIEFMNLKDVILCGLSMGGAITLDMLLKANSNIKAGIIINSGARLNVREEIYTAMEKNFKNFQKAIIQFGISQKTDINDVMKYMEEFSVEKSSTAIKDFDACKDFDLMGKISKIELPVLIFSASEDVATPVKFGEFLKKHIKNSSFIVLEDAAHLSPMEKPWEINQKILEFITNIN